MEDNHSLISKRALSPLAVAAGSKLLLESAGVVGAVAISSPILVGSLLAAGAFCMGKLFSEDDESESGDAKIIESLQRTSLNVEIAPSGEVSTTVGNAIKPTGITNEQVVVERNQGITYVQIQNLNINLTADVVQQLNMNPKEVFNQLSEQIKESTLNAIAKAEKR